MLFLGYIKVKTTCSKKKKEAETSEGQPHGIDIGTLAEE